VKEKRTILKKMYEHHIIAFKEHIRVFLLDLACKKNVLCAVGEACLVQSPTAPNEQSLALPWLITGQI
jgi:hypothetical protein